MFSLEACSHLLNKGITDPVVFMKRAVAYANENMMGQSLNDINSSLSLNPDCDSSLLIRATIYLSQSNYNKAISDMDHALRIHGDKSDNFTANLFMLRGMAKIYAVSAESALDDFKKTVQIDPLNGLNILWLHLARFKSNQNDNEEFVHNSAFVSANKWPCSP